MTASDTATPFLLGVSFLVLLIVLGVAVATLVLVLRLREQIRGGIAVEKPGPRRAVPVVDR